MQSYSNRAYLHDYYSKFGYLQSFTWSDAGVFCESFGLILLNSKFICVIGTVPTYLGNWGEKVNFGNTVAEIQQMYEREREKVGERECMNFGNVIIEIPAARSACPDVLKKKTNCGNAIAEIGKKKFCGNCGNAIAEIGKKKRNFFLVIVAMALLKMEKKKIEWNYGNVIAENGRKKKICCQNLGRNF